METRNRAPKGIPSFEATNQALKIAPSAFSKMTQKPGSSFGDDIIFSSAILFLHHSRMTLRLLRMHSNRRAVLAPPCAGLCPNFICQRPMTVWCVLTVAPVVAERHVTKANHSASPGNNERMQVTICPASSARMCICLRDLSEIQLPASLCRADTRSETTLTAASTPSLRACSICAATSDGFRHGPRYDQPCATIPCGLSAPSCQP